MDSESRFDSYEQDFNQLVETINSNLSTTNNGESLRALLRKSEILLDEADELVSQLALEIQSVPPNAKPQYAARLNSARQTLSATKTSLKQSTARFNLLSTSSTDNPYGQQEGSTSSNSDRARLLSGNQMLQDGTKRLQESHRLAVETESQGADILRDLGMQREQIQHARSTLDSTMGHLNKASTTLKSMIRRMYADRVVTGAIICVLLLIIGIVIYEKLF